MLMERINGILSDNDIREHFGKDIIISTEVKTGEYKFDLEKQLSLASIDLRFRNECKRFKKGINGNINFEMLKNHSYTEPFEIANTEKLVINPREVIFTTTLETVEISNEYAGIITGRSSFARLGIMVHCCQEFVNPGQNSPIALQIVNLGEYPVELDIKIPICQLILFKLNSPASNYRTDINLIERAAIVNNYKKIIKQFKTQVDIIQIAVQHLSPDAKPNEVTSDWINCFFEKVKDISEDDMKEIWGRILAGEFNEPNTYTKQLLHTLSIMDSTLAKRFQKIRSSCFFSPPNIYALVYRTNGKDIKNIKKYQEIGLFVSDLKELDSLGLIQHRFSDFHKIVVKNKHFYYGDKVIKLNTNVKPIALGNITLTNIGKKLCKISPMVYDNRMLEICLDAWTKLGYNPIVEDNKNESEE